MPETKTNSEVQKYANFVAQGVLEAFRRASENLTETQRTVIELAILQQLRDKYCRV